MRLCVLVAWPSRIYMGQGQMRGDLITAEDWRERCAHDTRVWAAWLESLQPNREKPHISFSGVTQNLVWRCADSKHVGYGKTPLVAYINWWRMP